MSQDSQFSEDKTGGWIQWFCALEEHSFFCEVDRTFFEDPVNLFGLKAQFPQFDAALKMILRHSSPDDTELEDKKFLEEYQLATEIYGLVHARFILTSKGLHLMREKYLQGQFGTCPKVYCQKQHVLPIGLNQALKTARVKVFCPRCEQVYFPKKKCAEVDGAYFGQSFPHVLLQNFKDIAPTRPSSKYEPKIFGFKVQQPRQETVAPLPLPQKGKARQK